MKNSRIQPHLATSVHCGWMARRRDPTEATLPDLLAVQARDSCSRPAMAEFGSRETAGNGTRALRVPRNKYETSIGEGNFGIR